MNANREKEQSISIPSTGRRAEGPPNVGACAEQVRIDESFIDPSISVSVQNSPVAWASQRLEAADVESPRFEAQLLLALTLHISRTAVVAELYTPLTEVQQREFERMVDERAKRIPLAYLRGTQEFYGMPFQVTPAVLIPRPETELLVEFALEKLRNTEQVKRAGVRFASDIENPMLFDVGTGSGCILTAILAHCPEARGVGFDFSAKALQVARRNARENGVAKRTRFVESDLLEGIGPDCCDVIVSNPPYIPSREVAALQPEVRDWEPRLALDGGSDGLTLHRRLAKQAFHALRPGGWLGVEVALGQAEAVAGILRARGFIHITAKRDLASIERIVIGQRPASAKEERNG